MQLHKTDKAREALLVRTGSLTTQERRILILSDGQRSVDDIVGLLGQGARPSVMRLVDHTFLTVTGAAAREPATRGALRGFLRSALGQDAQPAPAAGDAASLLAAAPVQALPPAMPSVTPVESDRRAPRRSLAATKMYMLDMLQLQRFPESAEIKVIINTSSGQDELVAAVLQGLGYIQRVALPSYAQRVFERVEESMPEESLWALDAYRLPLPAAHG